LVGIGARAWWFRASASDERSKKGLTKIRMRRRQDPYQGTGFSRAENGRKKSFLAPQARAQRSGAHESTIQGRINESHPSQKPRRMGRPPIYETTKPFPALSIDRA